MIRKTGWFLVSALLVLKVTQAVSQQPASFPIADANPAASTPWTSLGPTVVNMYGLYSAGAASGLAVDPANPATIYASFGGGGLWKSTDSGSTWTPLTDSLSINQTWSLQMDPNNSSKLYVGSAGGYAGGILTTSDGGSTWSIISGPFVGPYGADNIFGGSQGIFQIAVQPGNSKLILAGTTGGVYRSSDGGVNWARVIGGNGNSGRSVLFDPQNPSTAYAAYCSGYGGTGGLFKSSDAGNTWTALLAGLPTPSAVGGFPCALSISPSNPSVLIAEFNQPNGPIMFKTADGGNSWQQITSPPDNPHGVGVFISPVSSNTFFVGSADLYRSVDGGVSWQSIGSGMHVDMDAYAFVGNSNKLYMGNDGGIFYTNDVTATPVVWNNLNNNLATLRLYYGLSLHPSDPNIMLAGTQDEGTILYSGVPIWSTSACGDGGATAIDQQNPANAYLVCILSDVEKSTDGGHSFHGSNSGINSSDPMNFFPPLTIDPGNGANLYFGTIHVYQSVNGAATWSSISPAMGQLSSLSVSPLDSNTVYAAEGNAVWNTSNALQGTSSTWQRSTSGFPGRAISEVIADSHDNNVAYLTLLGYSGFSDHQGHIFRSTDHGASWTDISGDFPNIPVNDLVPDPDSKDILYIATATGAYWTQNGGVNWYPYGQGLPHTTATAIRFFAPTRKLRVSTFGRGVWEAPAASLPACAAPAFSVPAGTYQSVQTVTITDSTAGAVIRFTTDGSTPSRTSSVYSSPIPVSASATLKAICYADGYAPSTVASSAYVINLPKAATPAFSPAAGTYTAAQTVTLSDTTAGATIFYTTDGSTPTTSSTKYSAPISVGATETIMAVASANGYSTSDVASALYTINIPHPDFTLTANSNAISISPGGQGTTTLTITSQNGLNSSVTFACSGLPSGTSCAFSPANATISNGASANVTLTISANSQALFHSSGMSPVSWALLAFGSWVVWKSRRNARRPILLILVCLLVLSALTACSGGSSASGSTHTPTTSTVVVTANAGSLQHTLNISLTLD